MTSTAQVRRRTALAVALLAAVGVLFSAPAASAASPIRAVSAYEPNEGGGTLREKLDAAAAAYVEAQAKYDSSKALADSLKQRMAAIQQQLDQMSELVSQVAVASYRTGRLGPFTALLESNSPDDFFARAVSVEQLAMQNDAQLHDLRALRRELQQQQDRVFAEVQQQKVQAETQKRAVQQAENALAAAGGGKGGGFVAFDSPAAKPAPRNADGSWPAEKCTVDDPTTSGCLTPRTAHAYTQTKAAGFDHYVACFRQESSGEHPKGRACDWAANKSGFVNAAATGADKTYGDKLASFYIKNAKALGILYVIWYKQIWFPDGGWRAYSGGGDPASNHTNHVHLSML